MGSEEIPMTAAIRELKSKKVGFIPHFYNYEEKGGTSVSARELGIAENHIVKTLIMEDDSKKPMVVLMHGDRQVSTKQLARELNVKTVKPCEPDTANRHSGYIVGGTSPFGTRKSMPVIMQRSIADLPFVLINGGRKGFLVQIAPSEIIRVLSPRLLEISTQ